VWPFAIVKLQTYTIINIACTSWGKHFQFMRNWLRSSRSPDSSVGKVTGPQAGQPMNRSSQFHRKAKDSSRLHRTQTGCGAQIFFYSMGAGGSPHGNEVTGAWKWGIEGETNRVRTVVCWTMTPWNRESGKRLRGLHPTASIFRVCHYG